MINSKIRKLPQFIFKKVNLSKLKEKHPHPKKKKKKEKKWANNMNIHFNE